MSSKKLKSTPAFTIENKYNRTFSEEFKRNKVKDLVEKRVSIKQLCDLYQVSRAAVYKWLYQYSHQHSAGTKTVVQMESEAHKTLQLLQRVAELERVVGQKQLELDYTNKLIEMASAELGYDIKKKYRTEAIEWFRCHGTGQDHEMKTIYLMCNISKQGHHQALERARVLGQKESAYVGFMFEVREIHPGMGLRTMYEHFQPEGIGRDAFIALGLREGFRLVALSNPVRTTLSVKNRRYSNLLGGKRFTDVNQVWSSDLFYFQLGGKHYYVVLILDVYSRRIVGYSVADNMRAENNVAALRMALTLRGVSDFGGKLIHHSDRGSQYISDDYTGLLEEYGILISMCNEVYENAHIERANGTIKNDYLNRWRGLIQDEKTLFRYVHKAIDAYNHRPHGSLPQKMTPIAFESNFKELPINERPILEIYTVNNQISVNPFQLEFNFG